LGKISRGDCVVLPFRKWARGRSEKILQDCIQKIREKRLRKERGELLKRIKEAERQQEEKGSSRF